MQSVSKITLLNNIIETCSIAHLKHNAFTSTMLWFPGIDFSPASNTVLEQSLTTNPYPFLCQWGRRHQNCTLWCEGRELTIHALWGLPYTKRLEGDHKGDNPRYNLQHLRPFTFKQHQVPYLPDWPQQVKDKTYCFLITTQQLGFKSIW